MTEGDWDKAGKKAALLMPYSTFFRIANTISDGGQ